MIIPSSPLILKAFKGFVDETLDIELASNESPDNRNIETDKINGVLTKAKGFKKIGALGSTLLLDNCEAVTNWTAGSNVTRSVDATTIVTGTYSLKFVVDTAFTTGIAGYKTITAQDMSAYAGVGLYIKSSIDVASGIIEFIISEAAAGATPAENLDIPALTAGVWQYVYLPFVGTTASRDAIISFGLNITADQVAFDINIDNIDLVRTDEMPIDLCETQWTAKTNVTSTADGTIYKVGTYSAKHVIVDAFTTGLISTHVITSIDLSKYNYVGFWLYSTIALQSGDLSLYLDDTAACASPLETMMIDKALTAAAWTYCIVKLDAASSDTAIISVGLYANRDFGACTIYIDDIRALKPITTDIAYPKSDGSKLMMACNGNSVYSSTDAGANWTIVASGLNREYYTWFSIFNNECFWGNGSDYNMKYTNSSTTIIYNASSGAEYYMPKARYMWVHQETIPMLLYATDPVTVRYGDPAKLTTEADWFPAARSKDLQESSGDYLVSAIPMGERSVIFFSKSFIVLAGTDHANFDWLPRNFGIGCTIRDSVQIRDGGYVIWANEEGVYRMDESFIPTLISSAIKNKYSLLVQPSLDYEYWLQSTRNELETGTEGSYQLDSVHIPGRIYQATQGNSSDGVKSTTDAQTDWQAGTSVNTDLTTTVGDILVDGKGLVADSVNTSALHDVWGVYRIAQSFTVSSERYFKSIRFNRSAQFLGTGNITLEIQTDSSGNPSGTAITNGTTTKTLTEFNADSLFTFTAGSLPTLSASTTYHIVVYATSATAGNLYSDSGNQITTGSLKTSSNSGSTYSSYTSGYDIRCSISYAASLITQVIDKGFALATTDTFGDLTANITRNSATSVEFWSSTSTNNSTWSDYVCLGTASASGNFTANIDTYETTPKRYIKIKIVLNAYQTSTPNVHSLIVGGTYISATHNTGGSISKWGQFLVNEILNSQSIVYYIRSATTEGGLTSATWNAITPNNGIAEPLANVWIQFKIEFNTNNYAQIPSLDWFQANWITTSSSTLPSTLVTSIVYDKRYYLFGMLQGDKYNKIGFCLDRNWNWNLLYNYPVGAVTMFNDEPYFGSAFDGRVMQLFTGNIFDYTDWTENVDSYFVSYKFGKENRGHNKWFKEIVIFHEPVSQASSLTVFYDVGSTGSWTSLGTVDLTEGDGETRLLPNGFLNGRDLRLKFLNESANAEMKIYEVWIYYEVFERVM